MNAVELAGHIRLQLREHGIEILPLFAFPGQQRVGLVACGV